MRRVRQCSLFAAAVLMPWLVADWAAGQPAAGERVRRQITLQNGRVVVGDVVRSDAKGFELKTEVGTVRIAWGNVRAMEEAASATVEEQLGAIEEAPPAVLPGDAPAPEANGEQVDPETLRLSQRRALMERIDERLDHLDYPAAIKLMKQAMAEDPDKLPMLNAIVRAQFTQFKTSGKRLTAFDSDELRELERRDPDSWVVKGIRAELGTAQAVQEWTSAYATMDLGQAVRLELQDRRREQASQATRRQAAFSLPSVERMFDSSVGRVRSLGGGSGLEMEWFVGGAGIPRSSRLGAGGSSGFGGASRGSFNLPPTRIINIGGGRR